MIILVLRKYSFSYQLISVNSSSLCVRQRMCSVGQIFGIKVVRDIHHRSISNTTITGKNKFQTNLGPNDHFILMECNYLNKL